MVFIAMLELGSAAGYVDLFQFVIYYIIGGILIANSKIIDDLWGWKK